MSEPWTPPARDWCRMCGESGPHDAVIDDDTAQDEDDYGYPICDACVVKYRAPDTGNLADVIILSERKQHA